MSKPTLEQKLQKHFGVKKVIGVESVKGVDEDARTIKAIANTYFLIDSDLDMSLPNCCAKSIAERGPQSKATAKIKHQSDHVLNTKNVVGRIDVLDERKIDGKDVLYFESYIPNTRKGNDDLENYKAGIYDNHSIGFRYGKLDFCEKDSINESHKRNWEEYYPKALNPEVADEHGYFWIVKEYVLYEISVVSYGANSLTPYLGGKAKNKDILLKKDICERIDSLTEQLRLTNVDKQTKKGFELEVLQLKQIISELKLENPSKKDTQLEPPNNDNSRSNSLIQTISNNL